MTRSRVFVGVLAALFVCCFPAVSSASANTLVVDQNSIGGPCSDARTPAQVDTSSPWCTITHATAAAPSGSTVFVRSGSYPYQTLHSLGARSSYVTFEPYGYGTPSAESVTIAGVSTANTSFLRFEGFHLVGSDTSTYVAAIQIYIGSQNIQFIDNDITGEGVQLQTASHVLLQGNYIHNVNRNCALNVPDGGGMFLTGGSASNPPADDLQVVGNTIQDTPQDAINLVHNLTNVVIDGNNVSTTLSPQCGDHTDLVQIEGDAKGPFTITNNVFHDGIQFILRNATGLTIEDNAILRVDNWMQMMADPGARIINNTWYGGNSTCTGCGSLLIRDYAPGSSWTQPPFNYTNHMTGTIIENNIMRLMQNDKVNPVPATDYLEDYNLIYGPKQNNIGLQGTHTLFATPLFANATAGNYALAPGSPGTGAGNPAVAPTTNMLGQPLATNTLATVDIGGLMSATTSVGTVGAPPFLGGTGIPVGGKPSSGGQAGSPVARPGRSSSGPLRIAASAIRRVRGGGALSLAVSCNESCRVSLIGVVSVRAARRGHRAHNARRTTARLRSGSAVALRARHRSVLRLALPARLRRLIARGDVLVVTLYVDVREPGGGVAARLTRRLTVRAR